MVPWTEILAAGSAADLDLGFSNWRLITPEQADLFDWATAGHPLPDVDPPSTPSVRRPQGEVADGYLLLSMMPALLAERIALPDGAAVVNYGLNALRFLAPVRVGERIRGRFVVIGKNRLEPSNTILKIRSTIEVQIGGPPAVVVNPLIALIRFTPRVNVSQRVEPQEARSA